MSDQWDSASVTPFLDLKPRIDAVRQLANTANGWAVGCDLDGTLCDVTWRQQEAVLRNWDAFHAGIPHDQPVRAVLVVLRMAVVVGAPIVFFTGRPEKHRRATEDWLGSQYVPAAHVYMRGDTDFRPDTVVKEQHYHQFRAEHPDWDIMFMLEDRRACVDMWRSLGVPCFQVREPQY